MRSTRNILISILLIFHIASQAQQAHVIKDIYEGSGNSVTFFDNDKIAYSDILIFSAEDELHGIELWRTDGSEENTFLIKDINPGQANSDCQNFYLINDVVVFTAIDSNGFELWRTDGTEEGTYLLKDINPGQEDGIGNFGNHDENFIIWNDVLYFTAETEETDFELWRSDGTTEGTYLLKNIRMDFGSFSSGSFPEDYVVFNQNLFFGTREGLWKSDGTSEGTTMVKSDDPTLTFGLDVNDLTALEDKMVFWEDNGLWASDGTTEGTKLIKELSVGTLNTFANRFQRIGNKVLFPANDGVTGDELWISDGTSEGTNLVIDAQPGTEGYPPQNFVSIDTIAFFKYEDADHGIELWRSDGTAEGTFILLDIDPGPSGSFPLPTNIFSNGERIYFKGGSSSFNQSLWTSDGTAEGTFPIAMESLISDSRPGGFYMFNDLLVFYANTDGLGWEYHILEDRVTNSKQVQNLLDPISIYPNPISSNSALRISNRGISENFSLGFVNAIGQIMLRLNVDIPANSTQAINISSLPPGIYYLTSSSGFVKPKKIIVL